MRAVFPGRAAARRALPSACRIAPGRATVPRRTRRAPGLHEPPRGDRRRRRRPRRATWGGPGREGPCRATDRPGPAGVSETDRKSVEEGKSVSVRGDLGGRRIIKKKKKATAKKLT